MQQVTYTLTPPNRAWFVTETAIATPNVAYRLQCFARDRDPQIQALCEAILASLTLQV